MENWEKSLEKFLEEYKDKDYVVGALLCGSYVTDNADDDSDIDVYIITDNERTWRERGNISVDGYLIEYFINPIKKCQYYFEREYHEERKPTTTNMFAFGRILFDKTGEVSRLKEKAIEYYNRPYEEINQFKLQTFLYQCWEAFDEMNSSYSHKRDINFIYYILLQRLIEVYYYKNLYAYIPATKIERLYKDDNFRKKYHLRDEPREEFRSHVILCIDAREVKEKVENITKLYYYVICDCGGFDINNFKLRSDI